MQELQAFIDGLLWWHWIVFGLLLVVAEIVVPLFVVIWFGLGSIIVGAIMFLFATTFMTNLGIWIVISLLLLSLWFGYFKKEKIDKSGQPEFRLDTRGVVTEEIRHGYKGKVHFDMPVLGSSDWHATSDHDIEVGEKVKIVEVNGQLIKVKKIK